MANPDGRREREQVSEQRGYSCTRCSCDGTVRLPAMADTERRVLRQRQRCMSSHAPSPRLVIVRGYVVYSLPRSGCSFHYTEIYNSSNRAMCVFHIVTCCLSTVAVLATEKCWELTWLLSNILYTIYLPTINSDITDHLIDFIHNMLCSHENHHQETDTQDLHITS